MAGVMERPKDFDGFVGQQAARGNLAVFMDAAKSRGEPLDHVLIHGPPGLGKTTLAGIISNGMGGTFRPTSAPVLQKVGDLASILIGLDDGDVLFIDEIHRLAPVVEESLYSAMEDRRIDIIIGEGGSAKAMPLDLARFTLVGATTRVGSMSQPARDRFGITLRLEFYDPSELAEVARRAAIADAFPIDDDAALEIGSRSRGTPRIAGRLLRRARDFAIMDGLSSIDRVTAMKALDRLDVDPLGLDASDRRYLEVLATFYAGGPVGVETMGVALSEPRDSVEDVIEPFLVRRGMIARTSRGRVLTDHGWRHLGLEPPEKEAA